MKKNIVGIIGWPVSHSLSPIIQNRAFKELGLDEWVYIPMPVPKVPYIRIKEAVLGIRALGLRGANITVPYKEVILPYVDKLSDSARIIGAINTVVVGNDGTLVGHNTDGIGFLQDLREKNIKPESLHILILGAGGSARAIIYEILKTGCERISILNRTKTKADDIARTFQSMFPNCVFDTGILAKEAVKQIPHPDLIINTTSVGLPETKNQTPWDEHTHFSSQQIIYDIIYNPAETKLLRQAHKDGARAYNGLGMLIHQGSHSFKLWTGLAAPVEAMHEAAQRTL